MWNIIKNLRKKPIDSDAGFINGYYFDRVEYKKVYDAALKEGRAWKTPIYIKSLIHNPTLLLLQDKWLVDKSAFERALTYFEIHENLGNEVKKLSELFNELNNITFIEFQDYLLDKEDIDSILETMAYYGDRKEHFKELINPLEQQYHHYASPNNYEFERMNAGILSTLNKKYPNLSPLDDALRSPIYEDLGLRNINATNNDYKVLQKFVSASKNALKPIPYLPKNWTIKDYIKIHKSKGAEQLRELIHTLRYDPDLTQESIEQHLIKMDSISKSLSPTKEIIYSLGGLTAGVGGAIASWAIPWLFVTSVSGAAVSAAQLGEGINHLIEKGKLNWLNLSNEIAKWNIKSA